MQREKYHAEFVGSYVQIDKVKIIFLLGIVQNMSFDHFGEKSIQQMHGGFFLQGSLKMIQTLKYLPKESLGYFGHNGTNNNFDNSSPFNEENSLELELGKKKNHFADQTNSSTTIKKKKSGCSCKKTKCLKMYCECFSSNKMCTPQCVCYGCCNDTNHEHEVQSAKAYLQQKHHSSTKAKHQGCHCKQSQCRKKYCECFNKGLACGPQCKCEGCANGEHQEREHSQNQNAEAEQVSQQKQGNPQVFFNNINLFNSIKVPYTSASCLQ